MPGIGGLSIANNLLSNSVQLNLNRNQSALQTAVTRLSSGLRINTAADDPSGLAIAEKLQAQVNGFDQAVRNVQDANNAATVAEGALQTTTDILQRIRTLAVEASSDITSPSDKQNLQVEVSQLLLEVNRISQNTQFNGLALLDGSHAGFQPQQGAFFTIESNAALASAGPSASSASVNITVDSAGLLLPQQLSGNFNTAQANFGLLVACALGIDQSTLPHVAGNFGTTVGTAANGLAGVQGFTAASATAGYTVDGTILLQVINTGSSVAVQESFFNSVDTSGNPVSVAGHLLAANSGSVLFDNVGIVVGNFTTADVGVTSYIKISQNVAASSNPNAPAFNFQSGALEGAVIQLGISATNTQTLRISNINVLLSVASNPSLGAEDAIGQIDNALQNLLTQRANLGAVIVRLNEDQNNDNIASVNLQASESAIRDLNVAQQTTDFNRLQILVQVGTAVLSQSNSNAQSVLRLFP
jgi:flagellin